MTISPSNNSANVSTRTTATSDKEQEPIKVTARFQDSIEPIRHRPIIRIEGSHIVRTSIDSGRDNPFRPDGDIYKSADPIVDYYKQAANQSRPQSPNDNSVLIGDGTGEKKQKRRFWRKRKVDDQKSTPSLPTSISETQQKQQKGTKKSCLRRWLCCGCCTCCKSGKKNESSSKKRPMSKEDEEIAKRLVEIAKQEAEAQQKTKTGPLDAAFDANKEAYKEARRKFLRQQSQEEIDNNNKKLLDSTEQTNVIINRSSDDEKLVDVSVATVNGVESDTNDAKNKSQSDVVASSIENIGESNESIDKPPTVVAAGSNEDEGKCNVMDEKAEEKVLIAETTTETIDEDGKIKTATEMTTTTTTSKKDPNGAETAPNTDSSKSTEEKGEK